MSKLFLTVGMIFDFKDEPKDIYMTLTSIVLNVSDSYFGTLIVDGNRDFDKSKI